MDNESQLKLANAIKEDDPVVFQSFFKGNQSLNICFGRFPVLSLCYLYSSRTILYYMEKKLVAAINNQPRQRLSEPDFIYEDFKQVADKCLRFYLSENSVVEPVEMLALMGRSEHLKTIWQQTARTSALQSNVAAIYRIKYGKDAKVSEDEVILPSIRVKKSPKSLFMIKLIAIGCCMALLCGALLSVSLEVIGIGSSSYPMAVSSTSLFEKSSDNNIKLTENITVDKTPFENFSGTIDGKGHTITVNGCSFANVLSGKIKNLTIVYNLPNELAQSTSLFGSNEGEISNVNVSVNGTVEEKASEEVYISCFVYENIGSIVNCSVSAEININGDGNGNAFLCGFAAKNSGLLENCVLTENSNLTADTVDLGGLVSDNTGTIKNCINRGKLSQTTEYVGEVDEEGNQSMWSPNCGGITTLNHGEIIDCFNYGSIYTASFSAVQNEILSGGVCAINYGTIDKSKNYGDIKSESSNGFIYTGGICGCNHYYEQIYASVNNCGSQGLITLISADNLSISGGIIGLNYGAATNNFANCTFYCEGGETSTAAGGILGIDTCNTFDFSNMFTTIWYNSLVSNNFSVKTDNANYAIAVLFAQQQYQLVSDSLLITEGNLQYVGQGNCALSSLDELKAREEYWDEQAD